MSIENISEVSSALKDQGLALVRVDISGSDFKKTLRFKEIGLDKDIDRELATLGRKSVLGKEYPKLIRNNKDQIHTYLDRMGVRFGAFGTWAIPVNIYQEVIDFLNDKKDERDAIKERLLRDYEKELKSFSDKAESLRPGFGKIVLENAYTKDHIRSQIAMVIEPQKDIMSGISLSAVQGLSRMAKDYEFAIMKKAKDNNTRPVITRFTRSKLEEMRDYCYRFVFLTSVLNKAAEVIQDAIDGLPAIVVKGQPYLDETSRLMTALKLLHTPDELEGIATSSETQAPNLQVVQATDDIEEEFEMEGGLDSELPAHTEAELQSVNALSDTDDFEEFEYEPLVEQHVVPLNSIVDDVDLNVDDVFDDEDFEEWNGVIPPSNKVSLLDFLSQ